MTRRQMTLAAALVLLVALLLVGRFLDVPYVILSPGPVTDTLGNVPPDLLATGQHEGPVIQIKGTAAQPGSGGHLYLTTVSEQPGSCDSHPSLWQTFRAWLDKKQTVDPYQAECPPGQSTQQVAQQNAAEMSESQTDATIAALRELGYHSTGSAVTVTLVERDTPAAAVLEPNDQLLRVDGAPIKTVTALVNAIRSKPVGATVTLQLRRAGHVITRSLHTARGPDGSPIIGVSASSIPSFGHIQVEIGIDPDVVGGPSAGTALALGIIDKLTPGGLTGGRTIAGTGTIDRNGNVGPIGGIQQKVYAAAAAHATVFFAPASECPDAKAVAPKSLTLVKVDTLKTAVDALNAIKNGSTAFPHC